MGFETFPSQESQYQPHELGSTPELLGGPLKFNDLLTGRPEESEPILKQLKVIYKTSVAFEAKPARYRVTIMDPVNPEQPAAEEYIQHVFLALKEAKVPVARGRIPPQEAAS